jgi:effector-binding domain-containing protein
MPESFYISDAEVCGIAREVLKRLASRAKLPKEVSMRDIDGQIEFFIESSDSLAAIVFRPQKRVEEILREVEKWANENLRDVIPEEDFSDFVYRQMYQSDEDVEIQALMGQFYSTFDVAISKLDNGLIKLRSLVKKEINKVERHIRPNEKATTCMRFAVMVNEVRPLWDEIIKHFEEHHYEVILPEITNNEIFIELSKEHGIPTDLLKDVFKRQTTTGQERRKLEPLGFALRHSQTIVTLSGDHETLLNCYYEGLKYLKDPGEFPIHVAPTV